MVNREGGRTIMLAYQTCVLASRLYNPPFPPHLAFLLSFPSTSFDPRQYKGPSTPLHYTTLLLDLCLLAIANPLPPYTSLPL